MKNKSHFYHLSFFFLDCKTVRSFAFGKNSRAQAVKEKVWSEVKLRSFWLHTLYGRCAKT